MKKEICSEGYQKFFDYLHKNVCEVEEIHDRLREAIPFIAEELELGKLEICIQLPESKYGPALDHEVYSIYLNPRGCGPECQEEVFESGENGICHILCYPVEGCTWSERQREEIRLFSQSVYVLGDRCRLRELLSQVILTDDLTGVANTSGIMQYGNRLIQEGKFSGYTGVLFNIKNFKYINERGGSRQGDGVLREFGQKMNSQIGEDGMIARLDGDSFLALIQNENLNAFLNQASAFTVTVETLDKKLEFQVAIRAGIYPIQPGDEMKDVVNGSTIALDQSRTSSNQDYVWFKPGMLERAMYEKEVSSLFPKALDKGEFVVYYQPKVTIENNCLCGCEALVRWIRDGQIVPPMEFIPVLEREGTICRLDFYVFETVCRDIRKWLDMGIEPVRISTNFSKNHLQNLNLAQDIIAIVEKYKIDCKYLEVELTEMSGYEDYKVFSRFVDSMHDCGIQTSIDDFGTGYSSLNLLKDLNVDIIKLDKSFLNSVEGRKKTDEIVIKNIVNMVNELNMEVIAEGVETLDQRKFLEDIQCRMAQGFLYDRPLPHDEFEKRLGHHEYQMKEINEK